MPGGVVKLHPGQLFEDMAKARAVFSSLNWWYALHACLPTVIPSIWEEPPGRNRKKLKGRLQNAFHAFSKGGGRAADQRTQGAAVVKQSAFRRADVESASISASPAGRPAFQRGGEIGFAEVLVNHVFPLCLLSSAARSLSVEALSPASS